MKKLGVILILFFLCFLGTLVLRKYEVFNGDKLDEKYTSEIYDLRKDPVVDLDSLSSLRSVDEERVTLINSIIPSVVCISTEGRQEIPIRQGVTRYAQTKNIGSGVVVSYQGHIITNNHVIKGKDKLMVSLHDGREFIAKIIGTDPHLDIAVLKINVGEGEVKPLKFGNSDKVQVGQMVFAVGNPFGLGATVTQGIVSAKERSFSDQQHGLFQTDAAINPGNSGGPLMNTRGEVIGINVAVFSSKQGQPASQGVGFSLPANEVLRSFKQIVERGRPIRGYLGIHLYDLTPETPPEIEAYLNFKGSAVVVTGLVEGGPGENAGLEPKDIILSYGKAKPANRSHLIHLIQNSAIDEVTDVMVLRKGMKKNLRIRVADAKGWIGRTQRIQYSDFQNYIRKIRDIGLHVRDSGIREQSQGQGVSVYNISQNSLAYVLGVREGDRILKINGVDLLSDEQFYLLLKDIKPGVPIIMTVRNPKVKETKNVSFTHN